MKSPTIILISTGESSKMLVNCLISIEKSGYKIDKIIIYSFKNDKIADKRLPLEDYIDFKFFEDIADVAGDYSQYCHWGSSGFSSLMILRTLLMIKLVKDGIDFIYCDLDVVWIRDPSLFISSVMTKYDIASQIEPLSVFPPQFCLGFLCVKSSKRSLEILENHLQVFEALRLENPAATSQKAFDNLLENKPSYLNDIYMLPESFFPTGTLYKIVDQSKDLNEIIKYDGAYIFHANWIYSIQNKIAVLKNIKLWYVD